MWVDTKGEDGPQCIHHTPVGALMAQPPPSRSCRSLRYALHNTLNSTSIIIMCGTHDLQPVYSLPQNDLLVITEGPFSLRGECSTKPPIVQFLNGTMVAFTNLTEVRIRELVFEGYIKHEHPKLIEDKPTLHFSKCTNVTLQHVTVHITGQYGSGIALTDIVAHGVITLYDVSVLHNGTYGTGILCDIHGSNQTPANSFNLYMNNVQVVNTNTHTEYDPSMAISGIQIMFSGTGSGTRISLHNVTVFNSAPVSGAGLFVGLLDDMHNNTVSLEGVNVLDGWDKCYQTKNRTEVLSECARRQLEMIKRIDSSASKAYSSVSMLVQASHNTINITNTQVVATYGPMNVAGMHFMFANMAAFNTVHLKNVLLTAKENPLINRFGILVNFNDRTNENMMIMWNLQVVNSTTVSGIGIALSFADDCSRNSVQLYKSKIVNHVSKNGGSLVANLIDHAQSNIISLFKFVAKNNTATLGGGLQIFLGGSAAGNSFISRLLFMANNKAHVGGGVYIKFTHSSERNAVFLNTNVFVRNTLSPSPIMSMMGGGIHLEFAASRAIFATKNIVLLNMSTFIHNEAKGGVGGGLSLLYVHSPYTGDSGDAVYMVGSTFLNNQAKYGHAFAMQSSPLFRKTLFREIIAIKTKCIYTNAAKFDEFVATPLKNLSLLFEDPSNASMEYDIPTTHEVMRISQAVEQNVLEIMQKQINPFFQIKANTSLVLLISVQIRLQGNFYCGATSQGLLAVDSEIILKPYSMTDFSNCVASRGGGIALYGESYIRISTQSMLWLTNNYAFQRGGALYIHSVTHAVPRVNCFFQYEHGQNVSLDFNGIWFQNNSAKHEGQSVYISEAENCFGNNLILNFLGPQNPPNITYFRVLNLQRANMLHDRQVCIVDGIIYPQCNGSHNTSIHTLPLVASHPDHVDGGPVDSDNPITVKFIPGKQKQLSHKHAYDKLGNAASTVFTVQIITEEPTADVQLNPFSKYTSDFTVILHGIPLKHSTTNYISSTNQSNTTGKYTAVPQLALQSVDNNNLLLLMNIELQCCPPGYVYRIGSGDMGSCHCGMPTVLGIEDCNETDPNNIGAVLQGDHWAGYLPSDDQHSCEGQKFYTALCPPGYCQTQQSTLLNNNSRELLEEIVCGGSNRKGLLCGDCLEENSIAVNFNGMRPVCTSCQDGLSAVGLIVWILSEWVPMLVVMFIVMLFNIDLVSGRFNSFLLFAQLLAFSSIRGDAELGPVHIAFVKIYRFLYGVWNLDFFGVLLPPYCLIPHSHLTLLQTLLLHYSIGLFPLIVAITLIVLERSAEKWICCHRVDQCLRRMRRWKAKYSDGMSYDRALPAFVIFGFTRFLVSSSYILVNQTITGEDGEKRMVVWWQGSVPYGSIQHIAYFIPAIIILLVFVLLPSFLVLTLPIMPQLFGRLIIAVPPLRKLQRMQTFCSNIYTDRWIYHFVNVFQGCYKERYRSFSSLYLFHRIIQLLAAVFIPRAEDALRIQLILTEALLLLIAILRPYNSDSLNILDTAILGNMVLILLLSEQIMDSNTHTALKLFYASVRMILIYLPLLYPAIIFGRKVYVKLKCNQWRCCWKKKVDTEDNEEPLLEDPAARLGNLVNITELRAGLPTSTDEDTETVSHTDEL